MELSTQLLLASQLIKSVISDGAYLNLSLSTLIKNSQLTDQERRFITKIVYETIERKITLDYYLEPYTSGKRIKPWLKSVLRLGVYGVFNLRLADFHFTNQLVEMVKKEDYRASKFVNFIIRQILKDGLRSYSDLPYLKQLSIKYSCPWELVTLLNDQYPNQLESILTPPSIIYNCYRINLAETDIPKLITALDKLNITYRQDQYTLWTKESLINTPFFINGQIIAQDYSSQLVSLISGVSKDMVVLDACSAPGSKAIHLSQLMNNTGQIIACDYYPHKEQLIIDNALKVGATNISTLIADLTSYQFNQQFDLIIIDAPCSGLGTIHHKPDLKYRVTIESIQQLIITQRQLLANLNQYLNPGGYLVYSTCTINQAENIDQINHFLNTHPDFKLDTKIELLPNCDHDGFGIYRLQKTN